MGKCRILIRATRLLSALWDPIHLQPRSARKILALISTRPFLSLLVSCEHYVPLIAMGVPLLQHLSHITSRTISQLTLIRVHAGKLVLSRAAAWRRLIGCDIAKPHPQYYSFSRAETYQKELLESTGYTIIVYGDKSRELLLIAHNKYPISIRKCSMNYLQTAEYLLRI